MSTPPSGPLSGVEIVEIAGLGPAPYCAMLLAELGARVLRVDRLAPPERGVLDGRPELDLLARGRRSVAVDLKRPEGVETVLRLVAGADGLVEGFRPGVAERLGIGPDACLARNPALVYGRVTGWGRGGPLAASAGHDLNYIALSGALHAIGPAGGAPVPPLNLVGDFGGGGALLALGLVAALLAARGSRRGQVVDVAMIDGAASLMTMVYGLLAAGDWSLERGTNLLDGGAPYYTLYQAADGEWVSVAALEPKFYRCLLAGLGLDPAELPAQDDRAAWPELRRRLAAAFRQKSRAEWCRVFEGTDACFAPVLSMREAPQHPQALARGSFCSVDGVTQPAPPIRFSATTPEPPAPPPRPGADTREVLAGRGFSAAEIDELEAAGVIASPGGR